MPISKIRVITPPIGGGFGGKANPLFEGHAAFLSIKTGRPVKIELASEEDFICTNPRHASVSKIKIGAKKDGKITAFELEFYLDNGAHVFEGPAVCDLGSIFGRGPYWFSNYRINGYSVLTNKIVAGAFRGFGNPQVSWARESALNMLAEKLNMDPLELRKKNTIKTGQPMVTGQIVENSGIDKCIAQCEKVHGITQQPNGENQGRGFGFLMHPTGLLSSSAFVKIHEDGSVVVLNGAVEIGGGQSTLLGMVAAEELGVSLEKVTVILSDTDVTPYEWETVASRTTYNSANAVKRAAADAKKQLLDMAAEKLGSGIDPDELEIRDGMIFMRTVPEKKISVQDVSFAAHYYKGGPILGRGSFYREEPPRDPKIMSGVSTAIWPEFSEGVQVVDVEVDEETGVVSPLHIGFTNDCGTAVNPLTIEGQMQGGSVQGLGFALMEQYVFDNGKMVNPSLLDYAIPTAMDAPSIKATWVENPSPTGPFGARGIGEPGMVPTAPAVANAIYNAVGIRLKDLPMTPDKVLKAIQAKKGHKK
jgi:CO/xanthine dehydrogenase Mo-binding subunit